MCEYRPGFPVESGRFCFGGPTNVLVECGV